MKKYIEPLLFVVEFFEADVLTLSGGFDPNETEEIGTFEDLF